MIFRSLDDVAETERDVAWGNGQSRRLLTASDRMGFAVADTQVDAGTSSRLEYRNHLVACYCIVGHGEIEVSGRRHPVAPGTFYAMNEHEPTILHAKTEMRIVSIFNPPIEGHERHSLSENSASSY